MMARATSHSIDAAARLASRARGSVFMSCFGAAWLLLWWSSAMGRHVSALALIVLVGVALVLFGVTLHGRRRRMMLANIPSTAGRFQERRIFIWINVVQWLAIFCVANLLTHFGRSTWVIPSIILIVGLHFFPLAVLFRFKPHAVVGAALIIVALGYPWLTTEGAGSPAGCLATGLVLWIGAIRMLVA